MVLTTTIIIHSDPGNLQSLSTHFLLRSLLERCICDASTRDLGVSGRARTANVWSETNVVVVTQHPLLRFLGYCIESRRPQMPQRPPAISFCGALRRISKRMQGLYGGGIPLLHTRCSGQTLVAKEEKEVRSLHRRRQEHGLSNFTCETSSLVCVGTLRTL